MDKKDKIIAELRQQVETLIKRIEQLEEEVTHLKKDSSKPPSSDIVKPQKTTRKVSRKKRKRGGQHGHKKFTREPFQPEQVDEVIEYELTDTDAKGLIPLDDWEVIQQIELPEKMYKITEHKARKYLDPVTGKIYIATVPDEVRKGGLLGADMTAFVSFMKGSCHMSYSTIQQFCEQLMKLDILRGTLCKATQKISEALKSSYDVSVHSILFSCDNFSKRFSLSDN